MTFRGVGTDYFILFIYFFVFFWVQIISGTAHCVSKQHIDKCRRPLLQFCSVANLNLRCFGEFSMFEILFMQ